MLGHLSIGVRDLERAACFYDAVMAPSGWVRVWTERDGLGYGPPGGNDKFAVFQRADACPPGPGSTWRSMLRTGMPSMPSTPRQWPMAGSMMVRPGHGRIMGRAIVLRSCAIRRGGSSRPFTSSSHVRGVGPWGVSAERLTARSGEPIRIVLHSPATPCIVNDTFLKLAMDGLPPFQVLFMRGMAASIWAVPLVVMTRNWKAVAQVADRWVMLRCMELLAVLCFIVALIPQYARGGGHRSHPSKRSGHRATR